MTPSPSSPIWQESSKQAPGQEHTILIVDDNPTNLGVIADYLENYGFRILVARDGENALERAQFARPDLILLDVMMPGIDGFETCRRLKANEQTCDLPVIFMTALSNPEEKVKGLSAGAVDYVTKPLYQEEVLARVTTHLRIRDLTQRLKQFNEELERTVHQRTEELKQAYQTLRKLDKSKTDFIDIAAHEFRTPLTLIQGYAVLLQDILPAGKPEANMLVEGILAGESRLLELVNSLLDVSRITSEVLEVCKEPVQILDILSRVHSEFRSALQDRRQTLTTSGLDHLPTIQADPGLLSKVFHHLVINAIKYTPDGGSITVSGRDLSPLPGLGEGAGVRAVEIIVSDTGIGIDPDDQALIFEKFFQTGQAVFHSSGRTKFKGGGPGLGLSIAKGIVLAHGGKIWVESPGYDEEHCPGSQFHICLPVN